LIEEIKEWKSQMEEQALHKPTSQPIASGWEKALEELEFVKDEISEVHMEVREWRVAMDVDLADKEERIAATATRLDEVERNQQALLIRHPQLMGVGPNSLQPNQNQPPSLFKSSSAPKLPLPNKDKQQQSQSVQQSPKDKQPTKERGIAQLSHSAPSSQQLLMLHQQQQQHQSQQSNQQQQQQSQNNNNNSNNPPSIVSNQPAPSLSRENNKTPTFDAGKALQTVQAFSNSQNKILSYPSSTSPPSFMYPSQNYTGKGTNQQTKQQNSLINPIPTNVVPSQPFRRPPYVSPHYQSSSQDSLLHSHSSSLSSGNGLSNSNNGNSNNGNSGLYLDSKKNDESKKRKKDKSMYP